MSGSSLELGQFPVCGRPVEAEAFRRATGASDTGTTLPLSFPMRWLTIPDIRLALAALVGHGDIVLVHEGQSFAYQRPLHVGRGYMLTLSARREAAPERLILEGTVSDGEGPCATLETILRLVAASAEDAV